MEPPYRVYIDESGDHTYRRLTDLSRRYLGLTGLVIRKTSYDPVIPESLEALKKRFLSYDPDEPPVLVRSAIVNHKSSFWVLRDPEVRRRWDAEILELFKSLSAQIFTVVIDKKEHIDRYPTDTWDAYSYSLSVLLNRIRGWLNLQGATADIMPESRGQKEDNQLLAAYVELRTMGTFHTDAEEYQRTFPTERLLFRKKEHNVAGLQLADLLAVEQKLLTISNSGRPMPHPIDSFGQALNEAVAGKINQYGRYLLV